MKPLASAALVSLALLACGGPADEASTDEAPPSTASADQQEAAPDLSTTEGKIADAMSAAPPSIAAEATILDWPAEGGERTVLREGTNDWTCLPTDPAAASRAAQAPPCADPVMMEWAGAYMSETEPVITGVGLSYMLAGDGGASNVDPYASGPTEDNDWVRTGPHVMMVVPDPSLLEHIGTDHESGEPYVMWAGTPWAHIMMPVTD